MFGKIVCVGVYWKENYFIEFKYLNGNQKKILKRPLFLAI